MAAPLVAQPPQRTRWSPERSTTQVAQAANPLPTAGAAELVQLNIGPEVPLRALVELVVQRLQLNLLYDAESLNQPVRLRTPPSIPQSSLLPLLRMVLKAHDLTLQPASAQGWQQIVPTRARGGSQLPAVSPIRGANVSPDGLGVGEAVTQVFALRQANVDDVAAAIEPFLDPRVALVVPLPGQQLLMVTDYAENLQKAQRMISLLDRGGSQSSIEFFRLQHTDANDVGTQLQDLLQARSEGRDSETSPPSAKISIDRRTNQLIAVGDPNQIAEVQLLVAQLDVPSQSQTKVYALQNTSAERMDELLTEMLSEEEHGRIKSAVDEGGNKLLITGPQSVQQRIAELVKTVDVARSEKQSPVRFYRLKNVTAVELLQTLRSLQGNNNVASAYGFGTDHGIRGVSAGTRLPSQRANQPLIPAGAPFVPGPNQPAFPGSALPAPPGNTLYRGQDPGSDSQTPIQLTPGNAKVTADESTNTVIVVAEPEEQRVYAELIKALDRRRPQVLIEARLVLIDTTDNFSLGVEVSGGDGKGDKRAFAFTAYGLSTVDPTTGALSLIPGRGFNGTLVDPDVADVVVRALAQHRCARVLSAPRLVVYDNANGILTSVNEEPFVSTNINNVAATTAFAGFAEAGTTIEVTPHISGEDYLRLDYTISVNTFTGPATENSPPPRKTDEIVSTVTIPDGHTVIVGGLNQQSARGEYDGVPIIENIPLLRYLGGLENDMLTSSSLFVFLKPVILRDDKFRNLRALSEMDVRRANIRGDHPQSLPMLMK